MKANVETISRSHWRSSTWSSQGVDFRRWKMLECTLRTPSMIVGSESAGVFSIKKWIDYLQQGLGRKLLHFWVRCRPFTVLSSWGVGSAGEISVSLTMSQLGMTCACCLSRGRDTGRSHYCFGQSSWGQGEAANMPRRSEFIHTVLSMLLYLPFL